MKIFVGQIYIQVGATFPFSLRFQRWLGEALSGRVEVSERFCKEFGSDFELGFRISAKKGIDRVEIKGPTVFKRDKSVEFTIFLPYGQSDYHELGAASLVLQEVLQSVGRILQQVGLDAGKILGDIDVLRDEFLSTPGLLNNKGTLNNRHFGNPGRPEPVAKAGREEATARPGE